MTAPDAQLNGPICGETVTSPGLFTCTRPPGHGGDHEAYGTSGTCPDYVWPQK